MTALLSDRSAVTEEKTIRQECVQRSLVFFSPNWQRVLKEVVLQQDSIERMHEPLWQRSRWVWHAHFRI